MNFCDELKKTHFDTKCSLIGNHNLSQKVAFLKITNHKLNLTIIIYFYGYLFVICKANTFQIT